MGMSTAEWSAYLSVGLRDHRADPAAGRGAGDHRHGGRVLAAPAAAARRDRARFARWRRGGRWRSRARRRDRSSRRCSTTAGLASAFAAVVSSEEVPRGKPAPDVYLAAAERLAAAPTACAAVEDSSNGLRSAAAAGLTVIAIPRPEYPPAADALAPARLVLPSLTVLTPDTIDALS